MTRQELLVLVLQTILNLAIVAGRIADTEEGKQHGRQLEAALDHWIAEESPPQVP